MKQAKQLRKLLSQDEIYLAPGVFDGLSARLVELAGFPIVYASGGAIARSTALPDMGLMSVKEITDRLESIVNAVAIPVIADADNGYGNALNARHAIKAFERIGVAGLHLEDQALPKRCGHYEDKSIVSTQEFVQKIHAVRDIADPDLYIIARTDAIAVEGIERALERAQAYFGAGADMLFVEAPTTVEQIELIGKTLKFPKLLNMFYSGKTPIVPLLQLKEWGYQLVITPSDLQRAAIKAMKSALEVLKKEGNTKGIHEQMVSFAEREIIIGTQDYMDISAKYKA